MKLRWFPALASVLALAACGGGQAAPASPAPASTAAAPSQAAPASSVAKPAASGSAAAKPAAGASGGTKLVVSYGELVPQSVPIFLASDAGLYQKNGLDVDMRLIVSSAEMAALVAGEVQIASAAGSQVVNAEGNGADLVVTAAVAGLSPFRMYVQKDIKTFADLKGKSVGISRFGSPSEVAIRVALKKNNLTDKDVRIVEVGSTQARTAALIQGTIAGGMANPLEAAALEKAGLHSIYDLAKEKTPSAQSAIMAKRDWLSGHRDVMQHYVDAVTEAIARVRADKPYTIGVMKHWFKTDDEQLMGSVYDAYTSTGLWPLPPYVTPEMFQDDKEAATDPKIKNLDMTKIIDSSFVKSAADRGLDKAS
jgi:NitT/TauT family transport system substrate-binding protein